MQKQSNHVTQKVQTGNGGIGFKTIPPPPSLPGGGIPQPPPPPTLLPPGPWSDATCVFTLESSSANHHNYDTDSTEHSSHSSVLVDMGKVVGVLRTSHPVQRDYPSDEVDQDIDDGEEVPDLDAINEHPDNSGAESMVLSSRPTGGCASCAAAAGGKSPKPGGGGMAPGDLDDSLCGDPLMYATFVAPVHQYSTETEPSRQTSFNYPSRQPSFKQNSSEAEPPTQQQSFLGGQLPLPRCSSSGSANYDEVKDIYEEVPTLDRWPLPPLPREDLVEICSVEISQEELEQQLHMERMSFMSGSSAAEEEEEELYDEKANSLHLPPPPPPVKPSFLHRNHYPKETILDLPPTATANAIPTKTYRLGSSPQPKANLHWFNPEDSDGNDEAVVGTVRRMAKRERNKTTAGVLTTSDSKDLLCGQENSKSGRYSPPCSNAVRKNSFKRNKPARNKVAGEPHYAAPPPVPPHQTLYKPQSHADLHCSRASAIPIHDYGRLASPDQFSESSASFHENELIGHSHPQQAKWSQPLVTWSSDSSVTAEVHPLPQSRRHQQRRKTPPPAQFSNRDSVRESWISSESECLSGGPFAAKPHVLTNRSYQHLQGIEAGPHLHTQLRSPLEISQANSTLSRTPRSHKDLLQSSLRPSAGKSPAAISSTTFPRFTRSVTNLACVTPSPLTSVVPIKPLQQQVHSRSLSRESGSSSSQAGSRKDPLRGYPDRDRQNQHIALANKKNEQRFDDNEGKKLFFDPLTSSSHHFEGCQRPVF